MKDLIIHHFGVIVDVVSLNEMIEMRLSGQGEVTIGVEDIVDSCVSFNRPIVVSYISSASSLYAGS